MMSAEIFKYGLTGGYVVLVYWLSWVGMRRTKDVSGFAIGNKDMSPYIIGITLAASIASTATFVVNPGFVYVHGMSAYLHLSLIHISKMVGGLEVTAAEMLVKTLVKKLVEGANR